VEHLRASLQRVLTEGTSDTMAEQRYDVQDHFSKSGAWAERYWRPVNVPIFGSGSREIVYVVHRVHGVTRFVLARRRRSLQAISCPAASAARRKFGTDS
jgi:hypothetical protein